MNDHDLAEALRDLPPELYSPPDRFARVEERVSRRREAILAAPLMVAALVVAVSAVSLWTFDGTEFEDATQSSTAPSFWDRLFHRTPADPAGSCPAAGPGRTAPGVPAPPKGFDGPGLVPMETPEAAVVCTYGNLRDGGPAPSVTRTEITSGLDRLATALHWLPPYVPGRVGLLCDRRETSDPSAYLVRLSYASGAVVWLSTREDLNRCADSTNGRVTAPGYMGDRVDTAARSGSWPEAPPGDTAPRVCSLEGPGRLGSERQMVPPGASTVRFCKVDPDGGSFLVEDPAVIAEVTRRANLPPARAMRGEVEVVDAPGQAYVLTFQYPQGPSVDVSVDPRNRNGIRNGLLEADGAPALSAYLAEAPAGR